MEIFLIKARVERSEYMGSSREFDDMRLVKALNPEEAQLKYVLYWVNKGSEYAYSYYVLNCEVMETIS